MVEDAKRKIAISVTDDKFALELKKGNDSIYDFSDAARRRIGKSISGTGPLRGFINRLGGGVLQKVHSIKDALNIFKTINKQNTTAVNSFLTDFLISLQNDIFYVLNETSESTVSSIVQNNLSLIKEFNAFNGLHADPARAVLLRSTKPYLPPNIRDALKVDDSFESDNFEEIFITSDQSVEQLKADSRKRIEARVAQIIDELENDNAKESYFEQDADAFISATNSQIGDPVFDKTGKPIKPVPREDGSTYDKKINPLIQHLYSFKDGVNTKYTLIETKISFSVDPASITGAPSVGLYPSIEKVVPTDAAQYEAAVKVIAGNIQLPIAFLEKAKQSQGSARINLEWEHIVGLATFNIYEAAVMAKRISEIDVDHPEVHKAAKMAPALERLFFIAMKVDSLFTSFTDENGKLVVANDDPLTRAAILHILKNQEINYTEYNWVITDSETGMPRAFKRNEFIKRTTEISITGLGVEYKDFLVGGRVGLWGTDVSNGAKGTLSKTFISIAKGILENGIEEAMSKMDALEGKVKLPGSDSFVKSLAIASGLHNFDLKSKPAKAKTVTKKVPKTNISKGMSKDGPVVPVVLKKPKNTKNPPGTKSISTYQGTAPVSQNARTRSESLVALINYSLSSEVKKLMIGGPRLQNRTGRLADSAKVTSANSRRIVVQYMSNPYDVFSKDRGASPWNNLNRDPVDLISLAVRNILTNNNKRYARSVSIGRV